MPTRVRMVLIVEENKFSLSQPTTPTVLDGGGYDGLGFVINTVISSLHQHDFLVIPVHNY